MTFVDFGLAVEAACFVIMICYYSRWSLVTMFVVNKLILSITIYNLKEG
jgi:hypothetical protein